MQKKHNKASSLWMIDLAGLAICGVVTIAAYVFALNPLLAQRRVIKDTGQQLETKRKEAAGMNSSLLLLKKNTIAAREQLAVSDVHLETVDSINQQIAELTELLAEYQLTIDDVQTGRIMMGHRCDLVPIRISGKGGYNHFVQFLHKLSLDLPDICVAGLDMTGVPERPVEKGSFLFELFWFAAPSLS